MGFWGTKISDNDGTADVLIDWGKLVNKKHLNSDGYLENWAKAKITKTEFGKAFPKMLKDAKMDLKRVGQSAKLGNISFVAQLDRRKNKYQGYWHVHLILAMYIIGKNVNYKFHSDFYELVNVCGYQYAAASGIFFDKKEAEEAEKIGMAMVRSTKKKTKQNLFRYF